MNDRHMASRSQPLRLRKSCSAFDLTRSSGVGALRVANENAVSAASDTRVTDGEASLAAMSRMAARPDAHVSCGGTRRLLPSRAATTLIQDLARCYVQRVHHPCLQGRAGGSSCYHFQHLLH